MFVEGSHEFCTVRRDKDEAAQEHRGPGAPYAAEE